MATVMDTRRIESTPKLRWHEGEPAPVETLRSVVGYRILLPLLMLPFLGAILGAVMSPVPANRFLAESVVMVHANDGGPGNPAEWRAFVDALWLPPVISATRSNAAPRDSLESVRGRIDALGDPTSGLVRVRGRSDNQATAMVLADTATEQALVYMRRVAFSNLVETEAKTDWEFEDGADGWASTLSRFASRPKVIAVTHAHARFGSSSLRIDCRARRGGCGAAIAIQRPFGPGIAYEANAYLSALRPTRLRLVFGGSSKDVAVSQTLRVGSAWRLFTLTWTPKSRFPSAELATQATSGGHHVYFVDSARVRDPFQPLQPAAQRAEVAQEAAIRARRAAVEDRYTLASAAQPSGTLASSTGRAVLVGAAIGLAALIGGMLLANWSNRRRRRQKAERKPDPEIQPIP
jgi:hypothetical protein